MRFSSNYLVNSKWLFVIVALIFGIIFLTLPYKFTSAVAPNATIVVKPSNMNGWLFAQETATGSGSLVSGPGTPPLGVGSANLIVNGTGGELIGTQIHVGVPLADLTTLTYSTYRTSGSASLAPSFQINVDYDGTGGTYTGWQGRLVFEPYLTGTSPSTGVWETWDALAGSAKWWATGAPGNAFCPMAVPCTWAQVLSFFPSATIHPNVLYSGLGFKAGGGWAGGFDGNVDNFTIGVLGSNDTYDFEPETACTTTCYVNDATGNDSYGGDTPTSAKKTIQAGATAVSATGTVIVASGWYTETVVLTKALTLEGAGTSTIIRPDTSGPICGPGSICPGGVNVILVEASDITIHDLKIEGDNPTLTSGVVRDGADLDARNGIITNHTLGPVFNNLEIYDVTVEDIYLRGIYASSGGTFNFHDNTVDNVQGEGGSIAMFNFGGAGFFTDNDVSDANDGIASNWSTGTEYSGNTVTNSGSGIHSDNNGGSGGTADYIHHNTVTNCAVDGFGIWIFASYRDSVVEENIVNNCAVGLTASGQFGGIPSFIENTVDSMSLAGSTGVYVTTSLFGFGSSDVDVTFTNNFIHNSIDAFFLETQLSYTLTLTATNNSFAGYTTGMTTSGTGTFRPNASANWWDSNVPATVKTAANGGSLVDYTPWLDIGSDTSANPGFQGSFDTLWADDDSPQIGPILRVQEGVNLVNANGTVRAVTGTYQEQVEISKALTLQGDGPGSTTILSPATLTQLFVTSGPNNNYPILYVHDTDNANIEDLLVDGDGQGNANYRFIGIGYRNAGGAIDNVNIIDIANTPIDGSQHGVGLYAFADNGTNRTLNTSNSTITGFQKNGTVFAGANLTVNFTTNTVTGAGPINFMAQNGVQLSNMATGTIGNNTVSGFAYTPYTWSSTGILVYNAAGSIPTTGNHVSESMVNIYYINSQGNIATNTVTNTVAGMGSTPYWWGIIADPGEGSQQQPPPSIFDSDEGQSHPEGIEALFTTVQQNTLTGGGNGTAIEADSLGTETMTFIATRNNVTNWNTAVVLYKDAGATLDGTVTGNNLDTVSTVFNLEVGTTMLAYANNITNFTTAGLTTTSGTYNARHNWWGTYAAQPTGVDADSWNYLLGADVVTFNDGTGTISLADGLNGGNASLTGAGTLVIVNHGTGLANVPFGKGIPGDTNNACSDFYDMFSIGGSGSYDVSIPIKTGGLTLCDENATGNPRIFEFLIDGGDGSPDTSCSPDTACWVAVTATYSSGVLTASGLAEINLRGTPFATPSEFDNAPTAITLAFAASFAERVSMIPIVAVSLLLVLATAVVLRMGRRSIN